MADAYQYIDKQTLDLIKYPSLIPPTVVYGSDYNYSSNNLRGKLYQFCYRYKYYGKMKSVFSPYSGIPIPQYEELPNGDFLPDFHLNNYISVSFDFGHPTVEEVEVAYRIGNNGNLYVYDRITKPSVTNHITGLAFKNENKMTGIGVMGGYKINELKLGMVLTNPMNEPINVNGLYIISIDVESSTIYLSGNITFESSVPFNFYPMQNISFSGTISYSIFHNDTVDYPVPAEEANESFDGVPLSVKSFEVIESNRIVVGAPKTGFPNVIPDIDPIVNYLVKNDYLSKFGFEKEIYYDVSGVRKLWLKLPAVLTNQDYFSISLLFKSRIDSTDHAIATSYFYQNLYPETTQSVVDKIIEKINTINNIDVIPTPTTFNFKCQDLAQDVIEYGLNDYDAVESYIEGAQVKYNSRIYICSQNVSHSAPTGTTADNNHWKYLCETTQSQNVIVIRALPDGSTGTFYNYFLMSYGAEFYTPQQVYSIFKFGCPVNIGIEYFDYAGRLGCVNKINQMTVDIPNMDSLTAVYTHNALTNSITLKVKQLPPDWAYGYRFLIDKNVPWFFQFFIYGFGHDNPDIVDDNLHYNIYINRALYNFRDLIPKSLLSTYIFEKGDRFRLLSYKSSSGTTNTWLNFTTLLDVEIIGYDYPTDADSYMEDDEGDPILDPNGNRIRLQSSGYIITEKFGLYDTNLKDAEYLLYEIYRPRKESDLNTLYWETSKTFLIGNPTQTNRYHKGDIDQDPDNPITTPAQVYLLGGNVYRKMRYSGEADIYFPVESMHLSDFYESNSISIGRANAISEDLGQVYEESAYMWTNKFFEGSNINQLNKFFSGDDKTPASKGVLQSKYGTIMGLKEKGFILYSFQERKITAIYIGRNSLIDPSDGSERVTLNSKSLFGTVRPEIAEFGCQNAESISVSNNHIYFWDGNNSKWCRIAYNGIIAISDYGKNNDFLNLNSDMKISSLRQNISVWDTRHDELITTQRYFDPDQPSLVAIGSFALNDNKITGIGRYGGNVIASFKAGMILTTGRDEGEVFGTDLIILKVDEDNRTLYLNKPIPFENAATDPVIVTLVCLKKIKYCTLVFYEPSNAWKTQYPFPPEYMMTYGDEILSFINGRTYLHDSDLVPFNYFYGIQFEQYLKFSFNAGPNMIKIIDGIEIWSNKRWGSIIKGDITVKSYDERGVDMESKLPAARFRNVEGKFVSEFLRDMNTPGFDNENYALMDGRFLRGHACIIKLTNFETVKTVLFEIAIYFNESV